MSLPQPPLPKKKPKHSLLLGVDPGLSGGFFVLDVKSGSWVTHRVMPTTEYTAPCGGRDVDVVALHEWLSGFGPNAFREVWVEYVHAFGHETRSSMFAFGRGVGRLHSVFDLLGIPKYFVDPRTWQGELLFKGQDRKEKKETKTASLAFAHHHYPEARFPKTHDGISDAACIATYGYRLTLKNKELF